MVAAVLAIGALGAPSRTDTASAVSAFVSAPVCMPGRDAAALDTMFFAEPGGVIGADYQRAFALPDGRVFWTFQDAAVRIGGGEIAIVHNIAVLQDETCITVHYGGSRADPRSLFFADRTERFRRWFWPMDATLAADGTVAVFVAEMEERGDDYLTHTVPVGTWMASFDPTTDAVVDERRAANGSADLYGWSVTSDDEWTYLYAQCYRQFGFDEYSFVAAFDRSCATEVTVARIPRGQVSMPPAYWDGATWQPDPGRAVAIIDERDRRINANQFEWTGDGFVSVNLEGDWWGDTILLSRSEHPAGPFVEYQRVPAPLKCDPAECNSFFASWVPGAAANRPLERFVVSVAHNRWDGVVTSVYRPTYLHVDAPRHLSAGSAIATRVAAPGEDAGAVVLNVGVVNPADRGFLAAYPCETGVPDASSVNHVGEPVVSNLVIVRPDTNGEVCVFSRSETDVIVDQFGTFPIGAGFVPVATPTRIADTRDGTGVVRGRVPAGGSLRVPLPDGADRASALNVIAVNPSAPGYLAVYDCDDDVPETSNVNYVSEPVVSNLVVVDIGASSTACVFSLSEVDVVVDLAGSFVRGVGSFDPLPEPERLLDTREPGAPPRPGDGGTVVVDVPAGAAAVLNVAAVLPDRPGFVTVYPCDIDRPTTSNINHVGIPVVSNIVIARPSADGRVCVYTHRATDLVVDLFGTLPVESGFVALDVPRRVIDTRDGTGVAGQFGR